MAHYIWLSGGTNIKHYSRYYYFLSHCFGLCLEVLWMQVWQLLDQGFAPGEVIQLCIDDTTRKKSGRKIQGAGWYRNGAGSARQEYRSLWGLNFVYLTLTLFWGEHRLILPMGLRIYLKPQRAQQLGRPFESRSKLARQMLDQIADWLPQRAFLVIVDGGYATKAFLRKLPHNVHVVGRLPIDSQIYALPTPATKPTPGRPPTKGACLGSAKDWREAPKKWKPHPADPKLMIYTLTGIWHSVLPGVSIRVIAIWRKDQAPGTRRPKPLEAFFSTLIQTDPLDILQTYRRRWDIEISIRDANAFWGLAQDKCRNLQRIFALNSFRILMATMRILWITQITQNQQLDLKHLRPWYRKKVALSQMDIQILFEQQLSQAGVLPTPRFGQGMHITHDREPGTRNRAA